MNEVSHWVYEFYAEAWEARGFPLAELTAGLPSAEAVSGGKRWYDWLDHVVLIERFEERLGASGHRASLDNAQRYVATHPFRTVARTLFSPRLLYRLGLQIFASALYRRIEFSFRDLGEHFQVDIEIPSDLADSPAFFRNWLQGFQTTPELIGLPNATVDLTIRPRHATYLIVPPPQGTLWAVARRRWRAILNNAAALSEMDRHERLLRSALESLVQSQQSFNLVIEAAPSAIFVHREGRIRHANRAAAALLGLSDWRPLLGRSLEQWIPETEHERALPWILGRQRESDAEPLVFRAKRQNGELRTCAAGPVVPVDFDGEPCKLLLVSDISVQQQLKADLALSDRMASLGTLAAGIAHDINNPLTYVMGNVEAAALRTRRSAPAETVLESLALAQQGAERIRDIVRQLSTFTRGGTRSADVASAIDAALRMTDNQLRHRARVERRIEVVPPIEGDAGGLTQMLVNLLVNAAEALPEGQADNLVWVRASPGAGNTVQIEVGDNGPGVPQELRQRIFDPFFTTKPGVGSGLGLSICHRIATSMGGRIELLEGAGRGALFRITLEAGRLTAPPAGERPSAPPARHRLLIVEDQLRVAQTLEMSLSDHEVTLVLSGEEAVALCREREFDVVLCDLMMPGRDGISVYRTLAAERPGLERRIVFMTGGVFSPAVSAFLASIPNPCLEKPFTRAQVDRAIERVGKRADPGADAARRVQRTTS